VEGWAAVEHAIIDATFVATAAGGAVGHADLMTTFVATSAGGAVGQVFTARGRCGGGGG
jgi:hypothetical protein